MMTYGQALLRLRGKARCKLENNTYLECSGDVLCVRLHSTDVVRLFPDGSYVLSSGGFRTVTTKDRINRYGPCDGLVYQERGEWYIWGTGGVPFEDGMRVDSRGRPIQDMVDVKADILASSLLDAYLAGDDSALGPLSDRCQEADIILNTAVVMHARGIMGKHPEAKIPG